METVTLKIDRQSVTVPAGTTILLAARELGIRIPTLCYMKDLNEIGSCRVCLVEVKGVRSLLASCIARVSDGMEVFTNTVRVREARKGVVELLLSNHPKDCLSCERNNNCELQSLAAELGITRIPFTGESQNLPIDESCPSLIRDPNKCILCRRCIAACKKLQSIAVLGAQERSFATTVGPAFGEDIMEAGCTFCGQCINVCPVAALKERDDTDLVWAALSDPNKHVVVQTAPAVRVGLGEEFGLGVGALVTGKMVTSLKRLGFDAVFDTNFSADLTIMEEGHELLERLKTGGVLPMVTSCSPGWVRFAETYYPDLLPNLSTAKSPQQMFGAIAKTYYAQKMGIDPKDMVVVSIMPCTAKKFEATRPEMASSGYPDVDIVLTTRELAKMLKQVGIDLKALQESPFDNPLGTGTGAAVIFGGTGGVMEAALRTVYEVIAGEQLPNLELTDLRGLEGVKTATVDIDGTEVRVAVAHGLANAKILMEKIRAGETDLHFIEVMACPGGCAGGGGQPIVAASKRLDLPEDYRSIRGESLFTEDRNLPIRKSHENPDVKALYDEFLGKPLSEKSHHLLHTHYEPRKRFAGSEAEAPQACDEAAVAAMSV